VERLPVSLQYDLTLILGIQTSADQSIKLFRVSLQFRHLPFSPTPNRNMLPLFNYLKQIAIEIAIVFSIVLIGGTLAHLTHSSYQLDL